RGLLVLVTSGRRPAHLPVPYTTLCRSGVCTGQSVEEGVSQTAESLVEADPCPALTPVPAAGVPDPDALDARRSTGPPLVRTNSRSEEHTSELQSRENLVCRLLLEKKNK